MPRSPKSNIISVCTEIPVEVLAVILKHAKGVSKAAALRKALTEYAAEKYPYISAEEIEVVLGREVNTREAVGDTPPKDAATLRLERKSAEAMALITDQGDQWE